MKGALNSVDVLYRLELAIFCANSSFLVSIVFVLDVCCSVELMLKYSFTRCFVVTQENKIASGNLWMLVSTTTKITSMDIISKQSPVGCSQSDCMVKHVKACRLQEQRAKNRVFGLLPSRYSLQT